MAVPGAVHLDPSSDLVAIWKSVDGQRFQNYKAFFTILDINRIAREWLLELQSGVRLGTHCPAVWRQPLHRRSEMPAGKPEEQRSRLAAVRAPLRRLEEQILKDHIGHCVEHAINSGNKTEQRRKIEELMAVVSRADR